MTASFMTISQTVDVSSRCSRYSEASASEYQEHIERNIASVGKNKD